MYPKVKVTQIRVNFLTRRHWSDQGIEGREASPKYYSLANHGYLGDFNIALDAGGDPGTTHPI